MCHSHSLCQFGVNSECWGRQFTHAANGDRGPENSERNIHLKLKSFPENFIRGERDGMLSRKRNICNCTLASSRGAMFEECAMSAVGMIFFLIVPEPMACSMPKKFPITHLARRQPIIPLRACLKPCPRRKYRRAKRLPTKISSGVYFYITAAERKRVIAGRFLIVPCHGVCNSCKLLRILVARWDPRSKAA